MLDTLLSLFGRSQPRPVADTGEVERIGAEFRRRHTNFRLLLTAGKRLLSTLADMERAKTDGRVFGMTFLRAGTTALIVNAFRMIKHLEALAPQSAANLKPCFQAISAQVEEVLGRRRPPACGQLVADISTLDAAQADLMGARLAELGEVKNRLGLPVPEGFVVGACAYELFASQPGLREEMARRIQSLYDAGSQKADDDAENADGGPLGNHVPAIYGADDAALTAMSREIQALILDAPLPDELAQAITSACDSLMNSCGGTHLCVLPVSLGEAQGFTGSYPAQYSVPCGDVLSAYRRAVAGKYTAPAMARRLSRGIPDIDVTLCVGMLAVPESSIRGTCNSSDPAASALAAGLEPEDGERLAELARKLEQGLGAPARFEWLQGPDGAFSILRCGPEPAPDVQDGADGTEDKTVAVRHSHMEGSPVHTRLCELLELLSPLTLPPPEDAGFRASNCHTLRDVARIAHQRGVDAMFDFGRSQQDFSERQAKQLWAGGAAMQWWIINLEDAFKGAPEGKFIRLENIESPPFLAVWEGISAFPWAGPPPVDARGFLSIMYESTTNPEISITGDFDFGVQNHILLSKAYVSLSSRFGYHFVTIEALVGERARENFVSFQFRGGAAEMTRRARRIAFVSGLLAEFGFSLEIKEDALIARVEGLATAELMDRLRVLGYLIIHTRQLDMIMRIPEQVRLHREKILREIGVMLARKEQA